MIMKTTFLISCPGDKQTGTKGASTEIILDIARDDIDFVCEKLQECFNHIWDDSRTIVYFIREDQ